ncbi:MAG: hypothetical protein ACOC56_04150 [Atribacterota bacterium]
MKRTKNKYIENLGAEQLRKRIRILEKRVEEEGKTTEFYENMRSNINECYSEYRNRLENIKRVEKDLFY